MGRYFIEGLWCSGWSEAYLSNRCSTHRTSCANGTDTMIMYRFNCTISTKCVFTPKGEHCLGCNVFHTNGTVSVNKVVGTIWSIHYYTDFVPIIVPGFHIETEAMMNCDCSFHMTPKIKKVSVNVGSMRVPHNR